MSSYQINYTKPQPVNYVKTAKAPQSRSLRKGECVSLTQLAKAGR
jgi:hypothetical protein